MRKLIDKRAHSSATVFLILYFRSGVADHGGRGQRQPLKVFVIAIRRPYYDYRVIVAVVRADNSRNAANLVNDKSAISIISFGYLLIEYENNYVLIGCEDK